MNGSNDSDNLDTPPTEGGRPVSRRKIIVAGAMLAPVFMTMKAPTVRAQQVMVAVGDSPTASCQPARSYDPSKKTPVCDGKPDKVAGKKDNDGRSGRRKSGQSDYGSYFGGNSGW